MEDFKRIFERINIQQIQTFLLCGVDDSETDTRSYEQRINEIDQIMCKKIESIYPDGKERDDLFSDVSEALVIREQVYLEIGMKAGASLLFQLLSK